MSEQRFQRVSELFLKARGLGLHERDLFLDEACGSDAGLRRDVEQILAAGEDALPFAELAEDLRGAREALSTDSMSRPPIQSRAPGHDAAREAGGAPCDPSARGGSWRVPDDRQGAGFAMADGEPVAPHPALSPEGEREDANSPLSQGGAGGGSTNSPPFERGAGGGSGSRVGPYRLLEKIGEGGFGVVYVADQEQPVRRRVALKIIKLGMDTRQVVARFEAERQALVMIDHLHIAEVFDAGNRIEGNNCTGAGRGIDVDALGNIIIKNTCTGATNHAVDTVQ